MHPGSIPGEASKEIDALRQVAVGADAPDRPAMRTTLRNSITTEANSSAEITAQVGLLVRQAIQAASQAEVAAGKQTDSGRLTKASSTVRAALVSKRSASSICPMLWPAHGEASAYGLPATGANGIQAGVPIV